MTTARALLAGGALFAAALLGGVAQAEVYKSVDEHGNVVFSERPPKDGKAEVVKPRYAKQPADHPGMTQPSVPQSAPPEKSKAAPQAELTPEQLAAKQKNCSTAQDRLKQLEGPRANRLQYVNDKQELAFLTPELLEARIKEAKDIIARDCQPAE